MQYKVVRGYQPGFFNKRWELLERTSFGYKLVFHSMDKKEVLSAYRRRLNEPKAKKRKILCDIKTFN